jgi:hypothetical protein
MPVGDHGLRTADGQSIRKGRISPALRTALTLIVHEGLSKEEAGKRVGIKPNSISKALLKPHVKAALLDVKHAWLASETERAYLTVARLAQGAASEDVQLKAARLLIDIDRDASAAMPERARQVVQIVTQSVNLGAQLIPNQSSGVLEAVPYQALDHDASNPRGVGYGDSGDDDD